MIKADTLPAVKRQHLVNAFSSLKQKVLWKWENDTIPNKSENILIRKWMPQLEILCKCYAMSFRYIQFNFKFVCNVRDADRILRSILI